MQQLKLPHQMADYLCPVNGLCDIYEWKTGKRIPEELIFYSKVGFQMISHKKAIVPKMIFMGQSSIGKREYEFWSEIIGYKVITDEGKCFQKTLKKVRELLDQDIPVILFGLDMFHLPYQNKFYHKQHIPGHVVLMIGYDAVNVYVHDNSQVKVQAIPISDLEMAWAENYIGISKKNAYFGIDMKSPETDIKCVIQIGIRKNAESYLSSPLSFIGQRGFDRFIGEFTKWTNIFTKEELQKIYLHFIEYTGSILPELPYKISGQQSRIFNPHRASRDKFAQALLKYKDIYGTNNWEEAAWYFQKSGKLIEEIVDGFIKDVMAYSFEQSEKYIPLFQKLRYYEEEAFRRIV